MFAPITRHSSSGGKESTDVIVGGTYLVKSSQDITAVSLEGINDPLSPAVCRSK
jgi:hypothetical protein